MFSRLDSNRRRHRPGFLFTSVPDPRQTPALTGSQETFLRALYKNAAVPAPGFKCVPQREDCVRKCGKPALKRSGLEGARATFAPGRLSGRGLGVSSKDSSAKRRARSHRALSPAPFPRAGGPAERRPPQAHGPGSYTRPAPLRNFRPGLTSETDAEVRRGPGPRSVAGLLAPPFALRTFWKDRFLRGRIPAAHTRRNRRFSAWEPMPAAPQRPRSGAGP